MASPPLVVKSEPAAPAQPRGSASSRLNVAHPYARLYAKREVEKPRRKMWNHALEKDIFHPYEIAALGAPHRRTIYLASLEAHIDRLHVELLRLGFWPVSFDQVDAFKGLNSKTAKSMIAGLQHEASNLNMKLLELKRANEGLEKNLNSLRNYPNKN
ncbi:hypothetical protein D9757_002870 [Collybiopsis confluens]|uniref:Uncharacterized protein n=1 Tax=Collybiopsis confluens TaxID=2823264 RepID=A0A8H5HVW1_9AGAR|nr:hypothetical protein D9757_002870 [Collybiopsis confluens]